MYSSGSALRFLKELKKHPDVESHLVISYGGEYTIKEECDISLEEFKSMADVLYDNTDIGASIASGTFPAEGMVILPCSMKTAAGLAHGYSDNLLLRAADVCMKEQRQLVLSPRETPMSRIHLENLARLASIPGVIILPPVIAYYHHPQTLEDVEGQIIGKILARFGIESEGFKRWRAGN